MNNDQKGVIYILTNPSFPDYIKIGYASNVEERLRQLNRSECIPFAFRVYATYEVESALSDKKVHEIIDNLNPDLRAIETFNGKKRTKEFYAMSPEDAYKLLAAIASIHGCEDRLKLIKPNVEAKQEEEMAREIQRISKNENFSFDKCNIPHGAILEYIYDSKITCTVIDNRKVSYNGEVMYMSTLARMLSGKNTSIAGPRYFKYNGKPLSDYYDEYQLNKE